MEYKIIVNPAAGKGKALKQISKLEELLKQAKLPYEIELTTAPGHATEIARKAVEQGWPAVAAVGGDGTVNEVIKGLVGSEVPLAIIPSGTGNDLARSLNLPRTLHGAIGLLSDPHIISMDLGEDQDNYFACISGIGFPADVMYNVNLSKGIFSGSMAITWGILKTLKELAPIPVTLELDGSIRKANAQGIFILNTVYAGGGIKFSPQADITDGKLDVLVMRDMSLAEVLAVLPKVYQGKHLNHPKIDFYRVKEVKVSTDSQVRKMFDGNVCGQTPILARICKHSLKVVAPPIAV